jgi:UDP-GlcNAc3NAcA epimerase
MSRGQVKILTVVGARPQFIKSATVSRVIRQRSDISEVIVHTGQHFDHDMSDVFFHELQIPAPAYNLGIGGLSHGAMTGRQIEAIEDVLLTEKPQLTLVYGDTNSTLAGALASSKLNIPVAHVEAGLRSYNRHMPEEINRVLTDHIAELLFVPTSNAVTNLSTEGIAGDRVKLVGDVMYDAALFYKERAAPPSELAELPEEANFVLATIHRAENVDDDARLREILRGLADCGRMVLFPLHPRTRRKISELGPTDAQIKFIEPVSYLEMLWLEQKASVVATDSGGVQKEAFFFGRPCVTFREETEWPETLEGGCNVLVAANSRLIAEAIAGASPRRSSQLHFGSGNAAQLIVDGIVGSL